MKYMTSDSGNDGSSSITATFELDRDPDLAAVDIQNRVNTAQGRLPNAVKATGITITKSSSNFVFGAGVYSSDDRYDPLFMSTWSTPCRNKMWKSLPARSVSLQSRSDSSFRSACVPLGA
jgi:HAE1 family hydrophobic/amphiphilic exporter-1